MRILDELLQDLVARGIVVTADGDRLRVCGPSGAVTTELRAEMTERKAELLRCLVQPVTATIAANVRGAPAPLSLYQRRIWLAEQVVGTSCPFHIQVGWRIVGNLDRGVLQWVLSEILARHDVLRIRICVSDGEPAQRPTAPAPFSFHEETPVRDDPEAIRAFVEDEARRPFDLAADPPFRARLIPLGGEASLLLLTIHHIVADAWSIGVLMRELTALYAARLDGAMSSPLSLPTVQYADFARWQRQSLAGDLLAERLDYWRKNLTGAPTDLDLPTDRRRSGRPERHGATAQFAFEPELVTALQTTSQRNGVTLFMTLLSAYAVLLSRWSRQSELTIGCPYGNREHTETHDLIGFFVSTLVLRLSLPSTASFATLLQTVRETCIGAFSHDVPFDSLVETMSSERSRQASPLFQAMFVLQTAEMAEFALPGARTEPLPATSPGIEYDLNLSLRQMGGALEGFLEYDRDLFDPSTAERLIRSLQTIAESVAADPTVPLSEIPWLPASERRLIVEMWNETSTEFAPQALVHKRIEARASSDPDRVAIEGDSEAVTYRELDDRANCLAHYLVGLGARPENVVGLTLDRSSNLVTAILAVLKAGCVYTVLDASQPALRLESMINDTGMKLVIDDGTGTAPLPPGVRRVSLRDDADAIAAHPPCASVAISPTNLAYICFTSGSTGKPKGVMIEHHSVTNHAFAVMREYTLKPGDRVLQFAGPEFDVAAEEIFPTLIAGATLVLRTGRINESLEEFHDFVMSRRISVLNLPAPFWHVWVAWLRENQRRLPLALRLLITGSDRVSYERLKQWREMAPAIEWCNAYGPTEATVTATLYRALADGGGGISHAVSIGRPLANVRIYVLDEGARPVPIGVVGEIVIGGAGIARGYRNQPELTAASFVPDPFDARPGARMYRSGDLGRFLPDGLLEIFDRADRQVKIRGYRIEPSEIEACLDACPGLMASAIIVRPGRSGPPRIVAFVARGDDSITETHVREWIQKRLPTYMVPSTVVFTERLPVTPTGKIDRHALADIDLVDTDARVVAQSRTPAEKVLASIWSEVLGVPEVGIYDNFFELGGDSILALQIVARARQHGLTLTTRQMIDGQTVAAVADQATATNDQQRWEAVVGPARLTPMQRWFFEHVTTDRHYYNQAVMLALPDRLDLTALRAAIDALITHHDALRCRFDSDGKATFAEPHERAALEVVRLAGSPDARREHREAAIQAAHKGLDLANGPLICAVLFESNSPEENRLLLVIHHLVVDGVSWGILRDDLVTAYQQSTAGLPIRFPGKSTSYRDWAEQLHALVPDPNEAYLEELLTSDDDLFTPDIDSAVGKPDTIADSLHLRVELDEHKTELLIRHLPAQSGVRPDEILLAALQQAVFAISGRRSVRIDVERHGRTTVQGTGDVTRTVGWFTSVVPLRLSLRREEISRELLEDVKTQARRAPDDGIGFSVLRYQASDPNVQERLRGIPDAPFLLNYLGNMFSPRDRDGLLAVCDESSGEWQSPRIPRSHPFELNALVVGGRLRIDWSISARLGFETAKRFSAVFLASLTEILVRLGATQSEPVRALTAAFPQLGLGRETIDRIVDLLGTTEDAIEAILPLCPLQEGIVFHSLARDAEVYFDQLRLTLRGHVDTAALRAAWVKTVQRHSALRCCLAWQVSGRPLQVVFRSVSLPWIEEDWREIEVRDLGQKIEELLRADRDLGFELTKAPLMRVILIRVADDRYELIWDTHHIIIDGWSTSIVLREVSAMYAELIGGSTVDRGPAPSFSEYIRWLGEQDSASALAYWSKQVCDFSEPTHLPVEDLGARAPAGVTAYREVALSESEAAALRAFARAHRLTLNTLVQGAWAILLRRYSGKNEVLFGVTVSVRPPELAHVEEIVGVLINTVPTRVTVDDRDPLVLWLLRLRDSQFEASQFSYVSLTQIQRASGVRPGTPLFQTHVVFQNYPMPHDLAPLNLERVQFHERTNYPLTLVAIPARSLSLQIHYDGSRFDASIVQRMLDHLRTLLLAMIKNPKQTLGAIPIILDNEHQRLLQWSSGASTPIQHTVILEAIGARRAAHPDTLAVIGQEHSLTYAELDAAANRLANWLRVNGVVSETAVAVCLPRTTELIVAILAIWKAGGTYVPLDLAYPTDRLEFMIEECGAALIVAETALVDVIPGHGVVPIFIDSDADLIRAQNDQPPECEIDSDSVAYVIFTSGSTGRPKGVSSTHRGLASLAANQIELFGLGTSDRVLQFASPSFDASIWETVMALGAGASLCVTPPDKIRAGDSLMQVLYDWQITIATLPPTALAAIPFRPLPDLHTIVVAGEVCPSDLAERWRIGRRFFNAYGPTEASVCVTIAEIRESVALLPIGRPLDRVQTYVLDDAMRPVPFGVVGELYIGGASLARGYIKPEQTAASFVPNPFSSSGRLYRTGDYARILPTGDLEFRGRTDHQVKVRGFRVELGEIEAVLARHPRVRESAVLGCDDGNGGKRIEAWFSSDNPPSLEELREFIGRSLPEYMLPTHFNVLDKLPLTPSGKIDRKKLLLTAPAALRPTAAPMPARNKTEETLSRVWAELLGLDEVGIHDNFFDLGGDSLLAIQVVARANQAGIPITGHQIVDPASQTIASLAAAVQRASTIPTSFVAAEQEVQTGAVPLTPIQHWFFELDSPEPNYYNQALLLQVDAPIDTDRLARAAQALLSHHDALRLRFERKADRWTQQYAAPSDEKCFTQIDLSTFEEHEARTLIEKIAADQQKTLRLDCGPLLRLIHFVLPPGGPSRLLIIVHHLAVDGVSWRILLEDLFAFVEGRDRLPEKTSSFRRWAERLIAWANSADAREDLDYWRDPARTRVPPALDLFDGHALNAVGDALTLATLVPIASTTTLLRNSLRRFGSTIEELILTALALALRDVTGAGSMFIDLEWHGRDTRFDDVDLSRTIGWFTTMAPVRIELPSASDASAASAAVRSQLQTLPNHGIGFGALRYLSKDPAIRETVAALPRPQISFNYLGQWDQVWPAGFGVGFAPESAGMSFSPVTPRAHLLEVNCIVIDGSLRIDWSYPPSLADVVTRVSQSFMTFIDRLGNGCRSVVDEELRPAATDMLFGLEGLDDFVEREMHNWQLPGLALAVARKGSILHAKGYGVRDLDEKRPVTSHTLFGTGSVTKSFTASLLAALRSEGRLQWDQPIRTYLPTLEMYDRVATENLSARDLLIHRAGLPDHGFLLRYSGLTRPEIFQRLRYLGSSARFREKFEYSSLTYTIAGYLAEELAGVSWSEAINEQIFSPLQMKHSASSATDLAHFDSVAKPYRRRAGGDLVPMPFLEAGAADPACSIYCGAEDLLKFVLLLMNGGQSGGHEIFAAAEAAEMLRPQISDPSFPLSPGPSFDPEFGPVHWGIGLHLCNYRGYPLAFQTGHTDGFTSIMAMLPEHGIAAAAMGNLHACEMPTWIVYHVFDQLLGLEPIGWSERMKARERGGSRKPPYAPVAASASGGSVPVRGQYAGTYWHAAFGSVVIGHDTERLVLSHQQLRIELQWSHDDLFEGVDDDSNPLQKIRVQFDRNASEEVISLRMPLEPALPDIIFTRSGSPARAADAATAEPSHFITSVMGTLS